MTPELLCLCEGATEKSGSLCILHTVANLGALSFPTPVQLVAAMMLRFDAAEEGEHWMRCRLIAPDGQICWMSEQYTVQILVRGDTMLIPKILVMAAEDLSPGNHEFELVVDGRVASSVRLNLYQIEIPVPPAK